jgi:hypothetical protein
MLERTITVINAGNSTQRVIYGSSQGNCLAMGKSFLCLFYRNMKMDFFMFPERQY